jgi:DNA-binding FadR family transcriptional regulator
MPGLHHRLLDELGQSIVSGRLTPGTVLTVEALEAEHGISRSVVRETIRVLESMGLVASRRRLGIELLPQTTWNLYDPRVIAWRLRTVDRRIQLRELMELRLAIEPEAARLAARSATPDAAVDLMAVAGRLWSTGQANDPDSQAAFLQLDVSFHTLVLRASGNRMFAHLDSLVGETLLARTEFGFVPERPEAASLQEHVEVAGAVQRGDADSAAASMLSIMRRAMAETLSASNSTPTLEWPVPGGDGHAERGNGKRGEARGADSGNT